MFSASDVAVVRHVVQRILVPCVFIIGLLGNSVSIYVLTRKRMRCTTNIYLTALAITDIIYLTMTFLLSLQHYEYVQRNYEAYWKYYGIVVWLCDACAYISIYIAVCFTIERFIAIRYPLKRQTFCTESLAKNVLIGVALFCLFSTISTAFEHQYRITSKLIDIDGKPCNATRANTAERLLAIQTDFNQSLSAPDLEGSGDGALGDAVQKHRKNKEGKGNAAKVKPESILRRLRMKSPESHAWPISGGVTNVKVPAATQNIPNTAYDYLALRSHKDFLLDAEFIVSVTTPVFQDRLEKFATEQQQLQQQYESLSDGQDSLENMKIDAWLLLHNDTVVFNITQFCENVTYYQTSYSNLAQNAIYTRVWYFFTLFVFVLIPLCVLATFNCFLIMLVRRSKNLRCEMTNASSIRRSRRTPHVSSVSQENRVTVTLIAVVLCFIFCQLPWAIYLIVSENMDIDWNSQAIIGNILNFLVVINAAANFFLYCVLSDKYRRTVRELITGYQYKKQRNTNASLYAHTQTENGSRRYRHATSSLANK